MGLKLLLIHFFLFWHPELMIFCYFNFFIFFIFQSKRLMLMLMFMHGKRNKRQTYQNEFINMLNCWMIFIKPEMIVAISFVLLVFIWSVNDQRKFFTLMELFVLLWTCLFAHWTLELWLLLIKQHCIIMIN